MRLDSRFFLAILTGVPLLAAGAPGRERSPGPGQLRAPVGIDCGAGGDEEERELEATEGARSRGSVLGDGVLWLPDAAYGDRRGWGARGGERVQWWFAVVSGIWGHEPISHCRTARVNPRSYRFDLPRGEYRVELTAVELQAHAAGRRVFDVRSGGRVVAGAVDPFALAGYAQAFSIAFEARVEAGEGLEIEWRRRPGSDLPPLVAEIRILSGAPEREITAPRRLLGVGSYELAALFWKPPRSGAVSGYAIERRAREEDLFRPVATISALVGRWIDRDARPGQARLYRVRALGSGGRRGPASRPVRVVPRAEASSSLPVFRIEVEPSRWREVLASPLEDIEVGGRFRAGEGSWPARVRLHGASSRNAPKLSYRVEFPEGRPFAGRKVLYLKGEPSDHTLQQEKLTSDLFCALGLPASRARYVNLFVGGEYRGVYVDIERVDAPMLRREGFDPAALYRSASLGQPGAVPGHRRGGRGDGTELVGLLAELHRTARGDLERFVRQRLDWPRLRDYLATSVLVHRSEIETADFFWFLDRADRKWRLVPWDHNNGNFAVPSTGRRVGDPFVPLFLQSLQGVGLGRPWWYALDTRVFHDARLRAGYLERLEELAAAWLTGGRIDAFIDANFEALRRELPLDPWRWPPGDDEPFLRSRRELKALAREHGARLLRQIREARRPRREAVVINEFGVDGGLWVELRNRGREPVLLAGWSLGELRRPERPLYRFGSEARIEPGEYLVARLRERGRGETAAAGAGAEGADRRERLAERLDRLEARLDRLDEIFLPSSGAHQSLDRRLPRQPGCGTIALRAPEERLPRDAFYHGPLRPGISYGRLGDGFGWLEPTPGEPNRPPARAAEESGTPAAPGGGGG